MTAGATGTWTIAVANTGTGTARGVVVTDTIPAGVTYTAGAATSTNPGFAEQSLTANPDGTGHRGVDARRPRPGRPGDDHRPGAGRGVRRRGHGAHQHGGRRADEQPDGADGHRHAHVRHQRRPRARRRPDARQPERGRRVTWTHGRTNDGPSDARDVALADTLPADVSFVEFRRAARLPARRRHGHVRARHAHARRHAHRGARHPALVRAAVRNGDQHRDRDQLDHRPGRGQQHRLGRRSRSASWPTSRSPRPPARPACRSART